LGGAAKGQMLACGEGASDCGSGRFDHGSGSAAAALGRLGGNSQSALRPFGRFDGIVGSTAAGRAALKTRVASRSSDPKARAYSC